MQRSRHMPRSVPTAISMLGMDDSAVLGMCTKKRADSPFCGGCAALEMDTWLYHQVLPSEVTDAGKRAAFRETPTLSEARLMQSIQRERRSSCQN